MSRRITRLSSIGAGGVATPGMSTRKSSISNPSSFTLVSKTPTKKSKLAENSGDEFENNKGNGKSNLYYCCKVLDSNSISIKLTRLDTDVNTIEYDLGVKINKKKPKTKETETVNEEKRNERKSNLKKSASLIDSSSRVNSVSKISENQRSFRQRSPKNYNEDVMVQKQLKKIPVNKISSVTKSRRRTTILSHGHNKENCNALENHDSIEDENSISNKETDKLSKQFSTLAKISKITLTSKRFKSKTKELTDSQENIEFEKTVNAKRSFDSSFESGDDDNDKTVSEEDCESESENSDTEFSDDEENYSKHKIKNRKLPKSPRTPLKTPKKTPRKYLTPSMHSRTVNIVKPSTPLQEARLKLHVSVLPKSLPCREEQFNDIYTFLHTRLSDKSGGCIYISGVPGTGKTATVSEVIRCLKKSRDARQLTPFEFIDINGMKLSEPRQAYVQIWKELTGEKVTWEQAQKLLQKKFSKSNSHTGMTLLLVDELDLLCTKRQDVVYNLLDWPTKTGAKLVVVTIANTMDLPERVLMGKVTSRLGLCRLTFPPYNYKQLEEIVASRLRGFNAFGGETIQLVARKVAAVSGDARRALDICRRATEIAENKDQEIVSMMDVKQAVDEMIASPKIQAIKHCSEMEQLFLQAVCTEVHRTGLEEVVFKNVYMQFATLCVQLYGEQIPNETETLGMCARLSAWRLLLCEHSRMDIHQKILLNVSTDDVHFATKNIEV